MIEIRICAYHDDRTKMEETFPGVEISGPEHEWTNRIGYHAEVAVRKFPNETTAEYWKTNCLLGLVLNHRADGFEFYTRNIVTFPFTGKGVPFGRKRSPRKTK